MTTLCEETEQKLQQSTSASVKEVWKENKNNNQLQATRRNNHASSP